MQGRRNSSVLAMELHLSCINPSTWSWFYKPHSSIQLLFTTIPTYRPKYDDVMPWTCFPPLLALCEGNPRVPHNTDQDLWCHKVTRPQTADHSPALIHPNHPALIHPNHCYTLLILGGLYPKQQTQYSRCGDVPSQLLYNPYTQGIMAKPLTQELWEHTLKTIQAKAIHLEWYPILKWMDFRNDHLL